MRQFTAEYLDATREGMWDDSREALHDLALERTGRVLDVGAGNGALTRVLRDEISDPESVIALDGDATLLANAEAPRIQGDAMRLPVLTDGVDLVVCQALLVNLPDPSAAVAEFARVAAARVAAIEPDNSAVVVESTVRAEAPLARRARELYLAGVETDATLGARASAIFREAGLTDVTVRRYEHERVIEPPYSDAALAAAKRKVTGRGLGSDRETMLAGDLSEAGYAELERRWRSMGRDVVDQMQTDSYRRREMVPFFVTVGRVP